MPAPPGRPAAGRQARVVPVRCKAEIDRFIAVPAAIYADDPNWIAPLWIERRAHLDRSANPFFRHAEAAFWIAERDGRPVGRISAQIDRMALQQYGAPIGHFGLLEAEDDPELFAALLDTAEDWLRARGMRRIRGPLSLSINDEVGLLVDGFDTPPALMMGHARPYYAARLSERGYDKAKDVLAYDFPLDRNPLPGPTRRLVTRLDENGRIVVRPLRMRAFADELRAVLAVFNDAWSGNWGFVPMTEAEIDKLARDMKPLLREDFVWIAEVDGEAAAFGVALPNLNEAIADLGGRLLPFGWAKLLWRLKAGRIRSARLPLMGVRRRWHGTPLGAALAFAVIERLHTAFARRGFRRAELSWILEDNVPMRRILEMLGAVPYKTYRLFEKDLA